MGTDPYSNEVHFIVFDTVIMHGVPEERRRFAKAVPIAKNRREMNSAMPQITVPSVLIGPRGFT
jgi:hypothetical protein